MRLPVQSEGFVGQERRMVRAARSLWAMVIVLWAVLSCASCQAQEVRPATTGGPDTLRVDVNELKVGCIVEDEHTGPVRGLTASDFSAAIDENEAPVRAVGTDATVPIHVALLLDVSLSQKGMLVHYAEAAQGLVEHLQQGRDQVSIYTFASGVRLVQDWEDVGQLRSEDIGHLDAKSGVVVRKKLPLLMGGTRLFDATLAAADHFQGVSGRKAILVLTDGVDEGSLAPSGKVLEVAEEQGVSVSALEFGSLDFVDAGFLFTKMHDALALDSKETGGIFFHAKKGEEKAQLAAIIEGLKEQYLLYLGSPDLGAGLHKLAIQVTHPLGKGTVRYPNRVRIE